MTSRQFFSSFEVAIGVRNEIPTAQHVTTTTTAATPSKK
jgi:hypothetical protein